MDKEMHNEFNAWKVVMEAAGTRSDQKFKNFYDDHGCKDTGLAEATIQLSEKLSKYK